MKLEDYNIDDQIALNEFEDDEDAQNVLNSTYQAEQAHYIATIRFLRYRRERAK